MSVLISVADLLQAIESEDAPLVLDVRWSLAVPDGRPLYAAEHLPGAIYVDMNTELAAPASPAEGRHPLPTQGTFERAARAWGLNEDDSVVVYDDASGMAAARAWWLLKHSGVSDVRILDGGLGAWRSARAPLESGEIHPLPSEIELSWGHMPVVDADGAASVAREGVLLDARAGERYRGETEPIDPQAGHIPGAVSAPTQDNLGDEGDVSRRRRAAVQICGARRRRFAPCRGVLRLRSDRRARDRGVGRGRHLRGAVPGLVVAMVLRCGASRGHGGRAR